MKNCIYCGREMKYPTITQKLCSRECRRKYRSNYTKNRYNLPQVREWYKQYHQNKKKSLCGSVPGIILNCQKVSEIT